MIKHIVLADDDPDDCWLFSGILQDIAKEIRFTCFHHCSHLLEFLKGSDLPDLIFLDLNMPGIDGIACLKEIKNRAAIASIPVIIYSTTSNSKTIQQALMAGAASYYVKPGSEEKLKEIISKVIES